MKLLRGGEGVPLGKRGHPGVYRERELRRKLTGALGNTVRPVLFRQNC
jgi:hypothetical protein